MDQPSYTKPPLGPPPRIFALENRAKEVHAAIERYADAGFPVPTEWRVEYYDLVREIEALRFAPGHAAAPVVVQVRTVHRAADWNAPGYPEHAKAQLRAEMSRALSVYGMADREIPIQEVYALSSDFTRPTVGPEPGPEASNEDRYRWAKANAARVEIFCEAEVAGR